MSAVRISLSPVVSGRSSAAPVAAGTLPGAYAPQGSTPKGLQALQLVIRLRAGVRGLDPAATEVIASAIRVGTHAPPEPEDRVRAPRDGAGGCWLRRAAPASGRG